MINIALVYHHPLHLGGVETHLLLLLKHGDRARYRWFVIAPASPEFTAHAEALGAQVIAWQPAHFFDGLALAQLARLLWVCRIDLAHFHSPRAASIGRIAARLLRIPAVVTIHLPSFYFTRGQTISVRIKRWAFNQAEKFLNYKLTDQLIFVSSRVAEETLNLGLAPSGRMLVIHNGIDLALYADGNSDPAVRQALDTPSEAVVLCWVGRLDVQKGLDVLLEAMGMLTPSSRARLWLVGEGALEPTLQSQASQSGLEAMVRFLGARKDIPSLLRASDIFVLPSRYEALSLAVLEGMAAGRACVVSDVGDNSRLIENGISGLVVPPNDSRALATALQKLLDDSALRQKMGHAAFQRVQAYTAESMTQQVQAVYVSVLKHSAE